MLVLLSSCCVIPLVIRRLFIFRCVFLAYGRVVVLLLWLLLLRCLELACGRALWLLRLWCLKLA